MSQPPKTSVRVGAGTIVVDQAIKSAPVFYDELFALCDRALPGCGCDVVLLPERWGFRPNEAQPLDGEMAQRFGRLAREHGLWLIAPLAELDGGKVYNTQAVFTPRGERVFRYRKVHLTPLECEDTAPGHAFGVFDLPWFRAGIVICYDRKFPESTRCLAAQGAQVVFFASYGDESDARRDVARCLDDETYTVGAGVIDRTCGLEDAAFQAGMVMDPQGRKLAQARPGQDLVCAELPLDPATGRLVMPPKEHPLMTRRRPECYGPVARSQTTPGA